MGRKKKGTEQYRWQMLGGWGTFSNEGRKRELEPTPKTAQLALNRVPELEFKSFEDDFLPAMILSLGKFRAVSMLTGHDTGVDIECGSKLAMGNRMQLGRRKVLEPSATLVCPSGKGLGYVSRLTFSECLSFWYMDPKAVVGCEDGTVRVCDMYSRSCSRIIRMHSCPVTCIALGEDQLIVSGSSFGTVRSGVSSDQKVAALKFTDRTGIKSLCYNPSSQLVFPGSTSGYAACWDLRNMRSVWETRVSPNVLYSMQYLQNDTSALAAGGIDGVLRIVDQNNGEKAALTSAVSLYGLIERKKVKRLAQDGSVAPVTARPSIKCLAVGMKKVVTVHNDTYIRMWKFEE